MKKVVLLGSTGSIGTSTCKVVEDLPNDLELIGLAAGRNVDLLREQVAQFHPQMVSVTDPAPQSIQSPASVRPVAVRNLPATQSMQAAAATSPE